MKKIMKKALSLVLTLVMLLSLAPMTALAAGTGTATDPVVLESTTSTITTDGTGKAVYYLYEAPVAATYEITVTGSMGVDSYGTKVQSPRGEMDNYAYNNSLSIYVEGTDEVLFNLFDYETQQLTVTITMIEGTEIGGGDTGATGATEADAILVDPEEPYATLPGGSMLYYKVAVEEGADYTLTLSTKSYNGFDLYGYGKAGFGYLASSEMGVIEMPVSANSNEFVFALGNPNDTELGVMISMEKVGGEEPTNSIDSPEVITELGTYNHTMPSGAFSYWYKWVATDAGVLTVTTTNEGGYAGFTVNGEWECITESLDNGGKVMVAAGDVVVFYVSPSGAATVNMTASFEKGAIIEVEEDLGGGDETNFEWGAVIELGENEIAGPSSYEYTYTVHEFYPVTTGTYTFTFGEADGLMGIVSTNGMWITEKLPEAEELDQNNIPYTAVQSTEIVWDCTDISQSIWIAVMPNANSSVVYVDWDELVVEKIPSSNALPNVSLESYAFKGDVNKLQSFMYGAADGKVTLVQNEETGYYHVVPVDDDGEKDLECYPLLLVKLNDDVVSLASAIGYGNVKYVEYDGNGKPVYITYFNDMISAYLEFTATDAKLYPVTDDLGMLMLLAGVDQAWYEEGGAVYEAYKNDGVSADYMHYFAMYYLNEEITTLDKDEPVVDKEVMNDIIANNSITGTKLNTVAKNEAGEEVGVVTITFAAGTMKPVEGKEEYDFSVKLDDSFNKDEIKDKDVKEEAFVLKVNFAYSGELPAEATIYIPVPATYAKTTLYYYQVMEDGTLKFVCDAPVDEAGNAKVTQDHCSDYVLLTEKLVEETPAPGGTQTGDATNFALWIAVLGLGIVAIAGSVVMKKREF